jgi:fibronectin-binding autotransporter adhesin
LTGSGNGTRLRIDVPVTNTVAGSTFVSSQLGTGTISLGLSSADKVQLMSGSGSYVGGLGSTILNDIIFNSAQGTDFATALLLNATETTFAGTLVAGQASITIATGAQVPNSIGVLSGRVTSTGSSGGLVLRDSGQTPGLTVRLANATGTANDYQGTTSIEGNTTLLLGVANQVPNGVGKGDVSVAGSFNLGGFSDTINGLTGSGIVDGISSTPTLTVGDGNATASFSGVLKNTAGTLALVKIGSGTQIFSGTNTYGGSTSVSAGTLLINGDQSAATGAVTVAAGATLGGSGTVGGNTTITGIHSPGSSPGIQTFNGNLTYEAGAVVNWELIANSTGSAGTDYDQILLPTTGNLSFSGSTTLALSFNGAGSAVDWSNAFWNVNRSWTVYDLSSGVVSNPGSLVIGGSLLDSVGNTLSPTGRGYFNTSVSGQDVMLNFVAVPEPSTIVLLSGLAVGGFLLRRRRA